MFTAVIFTLLNTPFLLANQDQCQRPTLNMPMEDDILILNSPIRTTAPANLTGSERRNDHTLSREDRSTPCARPNPFDTCSRVIRISYPAKPEETIDLPRGSRFKLSRLLGDGSAKLFFTHGENTSWKNMTGPYSKNFFEIKCSIEKIRRPEGSTNPIVSSESVPCFNDEIGLLFTNQTMAQCQSRGREQRPATRPQTQQVNP